MSFYTYVLRSLSTGRFYVGHTANVAQRIAQHNRNCTPSLRNRGPWEIFHYEQFATRAEAVQRERQIKRMKSHHWIEQLRSASR